MKKSFGCVAMVMGSLLVATRIGLESRVAQVGSPYLRAVPRAAELAGARAGDCGRATLHVLEAIPGGQVAERKAWLSERSQPVDIAVGQSVVAFPRRAIAILEVSRVNPEGVVGGDSKK